MLSNLSMLYIKAIVLIIYTSAKVDCGTNYEKSSWYLNLHNILHVIDRLK